MINKLNYSIIGLLTFPNSDYTQLFDAYILEIKEGK